MSPLEAVVAGIWLMLPALIPNSAAVLWGGGTPMDFRKSWRGKRILGDGKTWRGFFGGALTGFVFGLIQIALSEQFDFTDGWSYGNWPRSLWIVGALAFGSMIGDSAGSFVKRRVGVNRGEKAPFLDQYNFVVGAFAVVTLVNTHWLKFHYIDGNQIYGLLAFLIVVPLLHRGVNIIGYKMGKKDVPW